jgi:hypothetical protein
MWPDALPQQGNPRRAGPKMRIGHHLVPILVACSVIGACASPSPGTSDGAGGSAVPRLMRARACQPILDWTDPVPWEDRWRLFERCQAGEVSLEAAREAMLLADCPGRCPSADRATSQVRQPGPSADSAFARLLQALRELADLDAIESQRITTSPMM